MGSRGVWLLDHAHKVAPVRYATEFDEIDDPGALTFSSYYAAFGVHQIACLRNQRGYLLLKNVSDGAPNVINVLYQARGAPTQASDQEH
jgi:hypothetical protein